MTWPVTPMQQHADAVPVPPWMRAVSIKHVTVCMPQSKQLAGLKRKAATLSGMSGSSVISNGSWQSGATATSKVCPLIAPQKSRHKISGNGLALKLKGFRPSSSSLSLFTQSTWSACAPAERDLASLTALHKFPWQRPAGLYWGPASCSARVAAPVGRAAEGLRSHHVRPLNCCMFFCKWQVQHSACAAACTWTYMALPASKPPCKAELPQSFVPASQPVSMIGVSSLPATADWRAGASFSPGTQGQGSLCC